MPPLILLLLLFTYAMATDPMDLQIYNPPIIWFCNGKQPWLWIVGFCSVNCIFIFIFILQTRLLLFLHVFLLYWLLALLFLFTTCNKDIKALDIFFDSAIFRGLCLSGQSQIIRKLNRGWFGQIEPPHFSAGDINCLIKFQWQKILKKYEINSYSYSWAMGSHRTGAIYPGQSSW